MTHEKLKTSNNTNFITKVEAYIYVRPPTSIIEIEHIYRSLIFVIYFLRSVLNFLRLERGILGEMTTIYKPHVFG